MKTKAIAIALLAALFAGVAVAEDGTSLSGRLYLYPNWTYVKTAGVAVVSASFPSKLVDDAVSNGTNANQMTTLCAVSGTLTNGQSMTWSLLDVTNCFGDSVTFDDLKFLTIKAGTNNVNAIKLAAHTNSVNGVLLGATNQEALVHTGGAAMWYAPDTNAYAIAEANHNLTLSNTGTNDAAYELYIGGTE